ncbi:MAG TPA: DUF4338 domain-containing protein, partial [Saccharofermentans sp.]|nr:DUF4338 domain-containing protein [Saccharofermentans sp.]
GRDRPGRRIKFILYDKRKNDAKVMAVGCLSSVMWGCSVRDQYIGWDTADGKLAKRDNIAYLMDLSTCIGIPPYSYLTSAKLLSMMVLTERFAALFGTKYSGVLTRKRKREITVYAGIMTTTINGKNCPIYKMSSYNGERLYRYLGFTKGYSTYQVRDDIYRKVMASNKMLCAKNTAESGSNPKLRILRMIARQNGIDEEKLVFSGEKRGVFFAPSACNWKDVLLRGDKVIPKYIDYDEVVHFWRKRWLSKRIRSNKVIDKVACCTAFQLGVEPFKELVVG